MQYLQIDNRSIVGHVQWNENVVIVVPSRRNGEAVEELLVYDSVLPLNQEHAYKMACRMLQSWKESMYADLLMCRDYARSVRKNVRRAYFSQPSCN